MTKKQLDNRLKRLAGQFNKIQTSISQDKDCAEIIPQFMAVKGALAGAFESYVKLSLDECDATDPEKMKRILAILVKS